MKTTFLILLVCALSVVACGKKGPLKLPDEQKSGISSSSLSLSAVSRPS